MSAFDCSDVVSLEKLCKQIGSESGVRCAVVINNMGNLIAGGFCEEIIPLVNKNKEHMMYMQLVLELKMRSEFDAELGGVNYIHSKRDNVNMISIPKDDALILIATERTANVDRIVEVVEKNYSEFFNTSDINQTSKKTTSQMKVIE